MLNPSLCSARIEPDKIVFGQPVTVDDDTIAPEIDQQLAENIIQGKSTLLPGVCKNRTLQTEIPAEKIEPPVTLPSVSPGGEFHIIAGSFPYPGQR